MESKNFEHLANILVNRLAGNYLNMLLLTNRMNPNFRMMRHPTVEILLTIKFIKGMIRLQCNFHQQIDINLI